VELDLEDVEEVEAAMYEELSRPTLMEDLRGRADDSDDDVM
jgi:hypothetical protein